MKKTFAILICAILLLGLLAGCGSDAGDNKTAGTTQGAGENAGVSGGEQTDGLVTVYLLEKEAYGTNGTALRTCKYDKAGNLVEEDRDGYHYTYVYDQSNRNIEWTRSRADGSIHQHNTYQYDEKGNKILQVEDYSEYHFEYKSTYNDKGQLVKVECTRNGEPFDTDTYTYDDQGRLVDYRDGNFSNYHYVYEGNITKEQDVQDDGAVYSETVYTYDGNGKLIKEEYFEKGELLHYYEYTRNDAGKVLETCRYDMYDDVAQMDRKSVNTYDSNGNLTEKKVYTSGELSNHYVYTYTQLKVSPERAEQLRLQAEKDDE